jgi:hypothetical protein
MSWNRKYEEKHYDKTIFKKEKVEKQKIAKKQYKNGLFIGDYIDVDEKIINLLR